MNRGLTYANAIAYIGVKRRTFDAHSRPRLTALPQGTALIFDRSEIDRLFDQFKLQCATAIFVGHSVTAMIWRDPAHQGARPIRGTHHVSHRRPATSTTATTSAASRGQTSDRCSLPRQSRHRKAFRAGDVPVRHPSRALQTRSPDAHRPIVERCNRSASCRRIPSPATSAQHVARHRERGALSAPECADCLRRSDERVPRHHLGFGHIDPDVEATTVTLSSKATQATSEPETHLHQGPADECDCEKVGGIGHTPKSRVPPDTPLSSDAWSSWMSTWTRERSSSRARSAASRLTHPG